MIRENELHCLILRFLTSVRLSIPLPHKKRTEVKDCRPSQPVRRPLPKVGERPPFPSQTGQLHCNQRATPINKGQDHPWSGQPTQQMTTALPVVSETSPYPGQPKILQDFN